MSNKVFLTGIIALTICGVTSMTAQVGINTETPKATLEVVAKDTLSAATAEGVIVPHLTGAQLQSKDASYGKNQTDAIVYVTSSSPQARVAGAKTINITEPGYYYFDGNVWVALTGGASVATSDNDWHNTGNAGTSSDTNFLGTTDDNDLIFKRNGVQAGWLNDIGENNQYNTAFGVNALPSKTTGANNTAVGNQAISLNTTGDDNTAVGEEALSTNKGGSDNTAIGTLALSYSTTASGNTAVGSSALSINGNATTNGGSNNTAVGFGALGRNIGGSGNTVVGANAAANLESGANNNIVIGDNVNPASQTDSYQLNIGNTIWGTNMNNSATATTGKIGINNSAPATALDIKSPTAGAVKIADGTQAAGYVLTSDDNGVGTWQQPITATTLSGIAPRNQDIPIPMDSSLFRYAANYGTYYMEGSVVFIPEAYIDLPVGLWMIDVSIPVILLKNITTNDWCELMILFSSDPTAPNYNSAGVPSQNYGFVMIQGPLKAGYINRCIVRTFLTNDTGATQRYYAGIGRATVNGNNHGSNAFFGDNVFTALSGNKVAYIYATSTNFVQE